MRKFKARSRTRVGLTAAAAVAILLWAGSAAAQAGAEDARDLVSRYLRAVYAQDYAEAYRYVSRHDRAAKSAADYLRENPSFTGAAAAMARALAQRIEVGPLSFTTRGGSAMVRFDVRLPDANSPALQTLFAGFDPDALNRMTPAQRRQVLDAVAEMAHTGRLPVIAGEESLELLKENGRWTVFRNWSGAVRVFFHAEVREGLPWAFEPVQEMVLAQPGETLHAAYRARNLSDRTVSAKARHVDTPAEAAARYLDIIQCFCFLRQVLEPGRNAELPLVFRVDWDTPPEHREFHVTYQFYPSDKFPSDNGATPARAGAAAPRPAGSQALGEEKAPERGTLEVRVKDHRDAIDDFRSVELRLGKVRLAPDGRVRSTDPGWLELTPQVDRLDLTRYTDGKAAATVYRGALAPRRFAAVDLQVAEIRATLAKTGAQGSVKNAVKPIRLGFEVKAGAATVVVLDLELLDLSDHPGRGYELLIKGYELYEDGRLLRRVPPA